ncbi:MAG: tetratricopeptide repeat protein [Myxococcales bacterium]|nr:tetratricopeptide repeat protein [Myxococcales bacterium]
MQAYLLPRASASERALDRATRKRGRLDEARRSYRRALAIVEAAEGPDDPELMTYVLGLGDTALGQGQLDDAMAYYRRAASIAESASTAEAEVVLPLALMGMAAIELEQRARERAREHAEQAVALIEGLEALPAVIDWARDDLPKARFLLARALWPQRAERRRARQLVEQARDALVESGADPEGLEAVERWLERHAAP